MNRIRLTSDIEAFQRYVKSYEAAGLAFENQASKEPDPVLREMLLRKAVQQKKQAQFYRDKISKIDI